MAWTGGAWILAACGGDGVGPAPSVPSALILSGTAARTQGDFIVSCEFSARLIVGQVRADGWAGTVATGEVERRIDEDGRVSSFSAAVGGPATLDAGAGSQVTLAWVGDQSAPDVRPFWKALERIPGTDQGSFHYSGTWSCATLGNLSPTFADTAIVADGTWTLVPE